MLPSKISDTQHMDFERRKLVIKKHTTIRNPSVTSDKSRAALTRFRAFVEFNRCSKSGIAVNHVSSTSVSSIVVAREGEILKSESKLDNGFSIFYKGKKTHDT